MSSFLDSVISAFFEAYLEAEKAHQEDNKKFNFPDAVDVEYRVIDDGK